MNEYLLLSNAYVWIYLGLESHSSYKIELTGIILITYKIVLQMLKKYHNDYGTPMNVYNNCFILSSKN